VENCLLWSTKPVDSGRFAPLPNDNFETLEDRNKCPFYAPLPEIVDSDSYYGAPNTVTFPKLTSATVLCTGTGATAAHTPEGKLIHDDYLRLFNKALPVETSIAGLNRHISGVNAGGNSPIHTMAGFFYRDGDYRKYVKEVITSIINRGGTPLYRSSEKVFDKTDDLDVKVTKWMQVLSGMPFSKQTLVNFCDGDIPLPISFLGWKPFMQRYTSSAILLAGGEALGNMCHGWMNLQRSADGQNGTGVVTARWRYGAHIKDRKRISVLENFAMAGFPMPVLSSNKIFTPQTWMKFAQVGRYKDKNPEAGMLILACGRKSHLNQQPFISLLGRTGLPSDDSGWHYDSASYYIKRGIFYTLNGLGPKNRNTTAGTNTICYHGAMKYVTVTPGVFAGNVRNQGHEGIYIYDGCMSAMKNGDQVIRQSHDAT
jgi:hypothetical protein